MILARRISIDIIKNTINALEPEINSLKLSESMDRIINRIDNDDVYYKRQIKIYEDTQDFKEVIKNNINDLKS